MNKLYFFTFLVLLSCHKRQTEKVVIKGSDTEVNLVVEEAEAFMQNDSDVTITITGGGSGIGITALFNGRCDIALSSRPLNPYEEGLAMRRGLKVIPTVFAKDAIAIIVHASNQISSLTVQQLGKIFSGEITNWSEVGGTSGPISIYGRQANSGTFTYIKENVVNGEFASNVKQLSGSGQIVDAIKHDKNSLGYVGIGYVMNKQGQLMEDIKTLSLQPSDTSLPISPLNRDLIYSGHYPLTRPLYQFTLGNPTGKIKAFIDFQLSPPGQKIIEENGFFAINK